MRKPDHVRINLAASDAGLLNADLMKELEKHQVGPPADKMVAIGSISVFI